MSSMENEGLSLDAVKQKSDHLCVCKKEAQKLCSQMEELGEESLFVSVNVSNKAVTYLGSTLGKKFLMERLDIVDSLYSYCNESYEALLSQEKVDLEKPSELVPARKSHNKVGNTPKLAIRSSPNLYGATDSTKFLEIIPSDHLPTKIQSKPFNRRKSKKYSLSKMSDSLSNVQIKSLLRTESQNISPEKLLEDFSDNIQLGSKRNIDLVETSLDNTDNAVVPEGQISKAVCKSDKDVVPEGHISKSVCKSEKDVVPEGHFSKSVCKSEKDVVPGGHFSKSVCKSEKDVVPEGHISKSVCNLDKYVVPGDYISKAVCTSEKAMAPDDFVRKSVCKPDKEVVPEGYVNKSVCNLDKYVVPDSYISKSICKPEKNVVCDDRISKSNNNGINTLKVASKTKEKINLDRDYFSNSIQKTKKNAVVVLERLVIPSAVNDNSLYNFNVSENEIRYNVNAPDCTESKSPGNHGNTEYEIPTCLSDIDEKHQIDLKNRKNSDIYQSEARDHSENEGQKINIRNQKEYKICESEHKIQNKNMCGNRPKEQNELEICQNDSKNQNETDMFESDGESYNEDMCHDNHKNLYNCSEDKTKADKVTFVHKCGICDRSEKSMKSLLLHKLSHIDNNSIKCVCLKCGVDFKNIHHLENHYKSVHVEQQYWICHVCGAVYNNKLKFRNHQYSHLDKLPFKCEFCHRGFKKEAHLRKHLYTHMKDKPFKCKDCDKQFACKSNYVIHVKTHSGVSYPCDVCGKVFKADERLRVHKKIHTDIAPHVCNVCGKKFKLRYYLQCHLQIHKSNGGHVCDICGVLCKTRKYLSIHRQLHRKDIYKCEKCKKEFNTIRKLNLHLKLHTDGKKSYMCDICGLTFKVELYLKRHQKIHLGQKFDCEICGGRFSSVPSRKRHMKRCYVPAFNLL